MRTIALVDGRLGHEIARFLAARGELAAVVLHPANRQDHVRAGHWRALDVPAYTWPVAPEDVAAERPDCVLSIFFGYKVPPDWLEFATWGAVNLHPGLLPHNRGRGATAWSLIDGSPAGATLHFMDEGFDTGPILTQEEVPVYAEDTGSSLSERVESAALAMFRRSWPEVRTLEPVVQPPGSGNYHSLAEIRSMELGPEDDRTLRLLRAKSYRGGGARFCADGRWYEATVRIRPVHE